MIYINDFFFYINYYKNQKYNIYIYNMKYLKSYKIFERSSLTVLGVPDDIMREIQINFEIASNAQWELMKYKKDIIYQLKNNDRLFLSFSKITNNIFIFFSSDNKYYIQYFKYNNNGWGSYKINKREEITITQLYYYINIKNKIYMLNDVFKTKTKKQRLIQVQTEKLEKITEKFKYYILKHFNNIIKRMYGSKYYYVMKEISKNLSKVKADTSATELLEILTNNEKLARIAAEYEDAMNEEDLLKLQNLEKKYNSLSTLDEYLIMFEEKYSEKYHIFLNIKDLIKDFGHMQIETAFMYFLYTGKIKELRSIINENKEINEEKIKKLKKLLIKKNIDFIHSDFNAITSKYMLTPLMIAASENEIEIIKLLLDVGVDVDKIEPYGKQTALMFAAIGGHYDAIKILIEYSLKYNINIDQLNYKSNTAFLLYCKNAKRFNFFNMNIIELFIDSDIDWNITNDENETFIDILGDKSYIIKNRYPLKYNKYIKNVKSNIYNL